MSMEFSVTARASRRKIAGSARQLLQGGESAFGRANDSRSAKIKMGTHNASPRRITFGCRLDSYHPHLPSISSTPPADTARRDMHSIHREPDTGAPGAAVQQPFSLGRSPAL